MKPYTFHITLYDIAFFGMLFTGLTFILLLWFAKKANRSANHFLAMALLVADLWIARLLALDIQPSAPAFWGGLPMQFSLALGPLIYFYVRNITRPGYKFRRGDLFHFSPLLIELGVQLFFQQLNPVVLGLAFISVMIYMYRSHKLIGDFYQQVKFSGNDRYRHELHWLYRLLVGFGFLWLLWIPVTVINYFYYSNQLGTQVSYFLYLLLMLMMIWMAAKAFLRPEIATQADNAPVLKPLLPAELKQKGIWLKKVVKENRYYQDPELSLVSLAEKLGLTTHELSRIINSVLKKSFNDFINEFRVQEAIRKMQDPDFDHITLLGIAFESGFNSQSTFNRIFKQMTGKSPVEYKNELKKEYPSYNLGSRPRFAPLILHQETTQKWSPGKLNGSYMLKNYLKIVWRNLIRDKVSSIINISGLAIGLACVVLIGLYINDEISYDRFFKDAERIYRVNLDTKMGNTEDIVGHTPPPAGAALANNFPEIESYTRILLPGDQVIHYYYKGQRSALTERNALVVDSNFLTFFNYPLAEGKAATCLNGVNSIVLTRRAAQKYFGDEPAIGKTLSIDGDTTSFIVTAVLKDLPKQLSLQFDMLQPTASMHVIRYFNWSWLWLQMGTYVKLRPNVANDKASMAVLENKFPQMVATQAASAFKRVGQSWDEFKKNGGRWDLRLQPITDQHLYSANIGTRYFQPGDIKNVYIFAIIAIFIMLLACVNFINLSTAQSAKRAKEIGIRKVLGSLRKQLIAQFITEAMLYTLLATVVAIGLIVMALPVFNQLADKSLSLNLFLNFRMWLGMLLLIVLIGALAGSYPAFVLTSKNPVSILKGSGFIKSNGNGLFTRNALVVFQFTVSTVLIICTIVVYKQLVYAQTKDLGFNKANVVILSNTHSLGHREETMRQSLLHLPQIANASISSGMPAANSFGDTYTPQTDGTNGNSSPINIDLSSFMVDDAFIPTLGMKLITGRGFSKDFADSTAVILNETAVKQIGWKNPIGKTISYPGNNNQRFTVIGVVKNFNTESLRNGIAPFALFYTTSKTYNIRSSYIAVRIRPGNYNETISDMQKAWKAIAPDEPFEYSFMDAEFDSLYRADNTIGKIFSVFTALSLTVACLGLLGLVIFMAEQRSKEIGIRKVLGASVAGITTLLSYEFIKLVLLAIIIASPIAWWGMNKWLQGFVYHEPIHWWIFVLAGLAAILIALITVSFQAIKAALANPVKSLRTE